MLSLIYSELLKMLRLWGLVDFDVEIFFPHDLHSLPRGYDKQKSKESDQPHIITSQTLLLEVTPVFLLACIFFFFALFCIIKPVIYYLIYDISSCITITLQWKNEQSSHIRCVPGVFVVMTFNVFPYLMVHRV